MFKEVLQCNDSCCENFLFLCSYNCYFSPLTFVKFWLCIYVSLYFYFFSYKFSIPVLPSYFSTVLTLRFAFLSLSLSLFLFFFLSFLLSLFLFLFLSFLLAFFLSILLSFYIFPICFTLYTSSSSPSTFIMFWIVVQGEGQHSIVVPTLACLSVYLYISCM